MSSTDRRQLGAFGEAAAAAHLQRNGYQIVCRNWRCTIGEIDLIAQHGDGVVFVEVRTQRRPVRSSPEETITPKKQARLVALAQTYLDDNAAAADTPWRIDVVAIEVDRSGRIARLNHLVNAVEQ